MGCRPDTSWEREAGDLYYPDFVTGYEWSPVLFARICKTGKWVGAEFASRYYDTVNYGILLYPLISIPSLKNGAASQTDPSGAAKADGRTAGAAERTTIMDHTSILPSPMYDKSVLRGGDGRFEVGFNGEIIFATSCGTEATIEAAIVEASRLIYLRIGDIVAVELRGPSPLPLSADGNRLTGTFRGSPLFDFHIK